MDSPLVSIIIPAYNAKHFLIRCYDSLVSQTLASVEYIFVNDGSTDGTGELLDELAKSDMKMTVIHQANEGQGIARNIGMSIARGSYIGFMDVDDYVDADMYEKLYRASEQGRVDVVWSFTKGNGFKDKSPFPEGLYNEEPLLRTFAAGLVGGLPEDSLDCSLGMSVCKSIFKRLFLEQHRIQFQSERLVNSEDMLFNMDVLGLCSNVKIVDQAYYIICSDTNPNSFSKAYDAARLEKFKHLRAAMLEKVQQYNRFQGFEIRVERRFVANVRVSTMLVATSKISILKKTEAIRNITSDHLVRQVLQTYPINKLPLMQRIFFQYAKRNSALTLLAITKLRYLVKG